MMSMRQDWEAIGDDFRTVMSREYGGTTPSLTISTGIRASMERVLDAPIGYEPHERGTNI
jgi:hypothetical protein